ncbi:hypothetical protein RHMOL_Rhmol02G0087700 [Rhododendron molle]|uniref:Uncharacterized protein n=1 Tax=Rhododendron molle TaxID=49168 RepID=A0ACC0PMQ9_RHOML|nr:hypothetical protein RHMOL_Rhmol02G0087700 [Rhododendron molle]
MSKPTAINFLGKIAFTAWNIWKVRNDYVFRNEKVNPLAVMARANFAQLEFSSICLIPSVHMDNQPIVDVASIWVAPNVSKLKANCDVAFKEGDTSNKVAVVIRDHKGATVDGRVKTSNIFSALQGELLAIREACFMVSKSSLQGVTVESDCREAIHLSSSEKAPPWDVAAVVLDIRDLARASGIIFSWAHRTANKAAHTVAALAKSRNLPCNWVSSPPLSLFSVFEFDSAFFAHEFLAIDRDSATFPQEKKQNSPDLGSAFAPNRRTNSSVWMWCLYLFNDGVNHGLGFEKGFFEFLGEVV